MERQESEGADGERRKGSMVRRRDGQTIGMEEYGGRKMVGDWRKRWMK